MGQTAFPYQAIRGLPAKTIAARNSATSGPLGTVSWAAASTGDVLTVQGDGTVAFAAVSAGIGGSTGSVDNAILRADGTGGATLQASGWIIADNYTSSPNATVNHASIQATGSTTNVSVSIVPKGSGAFSLHVPDGTAAGGNARGANAVDLSTSRSFASQVASGPRSFVASSGGTASGSGSNAFAGGEASGDGSVIFGPGTASGVNSFQAASRTATVSAGTRSVRFCGDGGVVNGIDCFAHGDVPGYGSGNNTGRNAVTFSGAWASQDTTFAQGYYAKSDRYGMKSWANGSFAVEFGAAQSVLFIARNKTVTNTAVTLFLDGSSARLTIPSGTGMSCMIILKGLKSDGSVGARFMRLIDIKNVGGTTSLETTPEAIGTDYNPSGCVLAITADDTNDAAQVNITGVAAETWRWVMSAHGVELRYGT